MKKIVVIATVRMGGPFATAFAKRTSHAVSIRGWHAGSSSAAALSRQLGVRVADDKELLAADVAFVATPPAALALRPVQSFRTHADFSLLIRLDECIGDLSPIQKWFIQHGVSRNSGSGLI